MPRLIAALALSPLPRWHRRAVAPQAALAQARIALLAVVASAILGRLLLRVLPIPPCHPRADLRITDVQSLAALTAALRLRPQLADLSLVNIRSRTIGEYLLVLHHARKTLRRFISESLILSRRVNTSDADAVPLPVGSEDGERVTALHFSDDTRQLEGECRKCGKGKQQRERDLPGSRQGAVLGVNNYTTYLLYLSLPESKL